MSLERRTLPQPPVKSAQLVLPDGRPVTYARLFYIGSDASRELQALLRAGEANDAAGYIVDLRNNPGGVFEEAVAMASYFLPDGAVIARTVRSGDLVDETWCVGGLSPEVFPDLPGRLTTKPLVLLVNAGTASACEVRPSAHCLHSTGCPSAGALHTLAAKFHNSPFNFANAL